MVFCPGASPSWSTSMVTRYSSRPSQLSWAISVPFMKIFIQWALSSANPRRATFTVATSPDGLTPGRSMTKSAAVLGRIRSMNQRSTESSPGARPQ